MSAWWDGLSTVLKVLYCIAIPSTLILILQTILVILGFGDGADAGNPSDTSGLDMPDGADAIELGDTGNDFTEAMDGAELAEAAADFGTLRLFTLQGIVALLTTFAWVAICLIKGGMQLAPAVFLSALCGAAMMYLVAKLMQWSMKLTENGTFNIRSAIGEIAQVYVMIPPAGETGGKVILTLASGFAELAAITEDNEMIPAGTQVRITDLNGETVVVERVPTN